ncbi:MAG: hypothetical protein JRM85_03890 [Nitrososphaerota archaeon]|nr:hypothetical protein [Nitrososphaerota archaeon]MDG6916717.1 hypothetical protein [Nitrososphaerota archaeon]MDG6919334.1 hypothetical protein [Nitrososphaerota archaeon]MDG6955691.1 hypothetical protein [Nitrososphaerota archaeon]
MGEEALEVTCLSVDRAHRKRGVAKVALSAALKSIESQGGGVVEAFPVTRRGALVAWFGTRSMFEEHGCRAVAPYRKSNVLMRKKV